MPYTLGTIVWYQKDAADPDITYLGTDPCAATVTAIHSPLSADLTIMVDNDTPVLRANVPLVAPGAKAPAGAYATEQRAATLAKEQP